LKIGDALKIQNTTEKVVRDIKWNKYVVALEIYHLLTTEDCSPS